MICPAFCLGILSYPPSSKLFLSNSWYSLLSLPFTKLCPGWTNLWIEIAPCLPAAIASIANLGPVYASPPTNISSWAVWYVNGSALTVLLGFNSTLLPFNILPQSIAWPTDINT